jgi:hypothetical protein
VWIIAAILLRAAAARIPDFLSRGPKSHAVRQRSGLDYGIQGFDAVLVARRFDQVW